MERYLRVNLLGPDPGLMKIEFTGPRSHKGSDTLAQTIVVQETARNLTFEKPKRLNIRNTPLNDLSLLVYKDR